MPMGMVAVGVTGMTAVRVPGQWERGVLADRVKDLFPVGLGAGRERTGEAGVGEESSRCDGEERKTKDQPQGILEGA